MESNYKIYLIKTISTLSIIHFLLLISSCGQENRNKVSRTETDATEVIQEHSFEIDPMIKKEVLSRISNPKVEQLPEGLSIHKTPLLADFYENGETVLSTWKLERSEVFKSSFYEQNESIIIDGAFGLFEGVGFTIKINGDTARVYHTIFSESPFTSLTRKGTLQTRLEVPCSESQLILSEKPQLKPGKIIYGKVSFNSHPYFQSGATVEGKEIEARTEARASMTIYFKSQYLALEKFRNKTVIHGKPKAAN